AFLLFTFFLGFAVILGAEFNAAVQEFWPARASRLTRIGYWLTRKLRSAVPRAISGEPEPKHPSKDKPEPLRSAS
ncbi:YihY/virulence factor BrkB family protein, partial [Nocardia gipuzkoensis]